LQLYLEIILLLEQKVSEKIQIQLANLPISALWLQKYSYKRNRLEQSRRRITTKKEKRKLHFLFFLNTILKSDNFIWKLFLAIL